MQRQILQISLHQTSVMDMSQPVNRLRQTNRTTVQLGQEILQLCGIRMQVRQVSPQIRIIDIRQTHRLDVSLQHRLPVIPHLQVLKSQRIQRAAQPAGQAHRTFEVPHLRDKQRQISRHDLRLVELQRKRDLVSRLTQIQRIAGRELHLNTTHIHPRLWQLRPQHRHTKHRIIEDDMRLHVFYDEPLILAHIRRQLTNLRIDLGFTQLVQVHLGVR